MAVTHADLSFSRRKADLSSKWGTFLLVLALICGLCAFISCLIAEATRSDATWVLVNTEKKGEGYGCVYSGSGIIPLSSALGAFLVLAVGMVIEQAYIFGAVSKQQGLPETPTPSLIAWNSNSSSGKSLKLQAAFYFLGAWICFAVGEVLLMIGIGVESGHLVNWKRARPSCLVIRPGLFAAAGVFGLSTVFFAAALYLTALRTQRIEENEENLRREILEASFIYASPARSPGNSIPLASLTANSRAREEHQLSHVQQSHAYQAPAKPSSSL